MTIAVIIKVHDGVVLAADSASTLIQTSGAPGDAPNVLNVYNHANKIVNLVKGRPLGIITWGAGSIGMASMTTIFKDLRRIFAGDDPGPGDADWRIDEAYNVRETAGRVREYVFENLYKEQAFPDGKWPELGMVVAGYSSGQPNGEAWEISVDANGNCEEPVQRIPCNEAGLTAGGQPEAISRLIFGVDPRMAGLLSDQLGVPPDQVGVVVDILQRGLQVPVVFDAMPIQDALDLAEFLVDVTIKMSRFMPGPGTVGGPLELAAITRHEGFRWVKRKHYYPANLNP